MVGRLLLFFCVFSIYLYAHEISDVKVEATIDLQNRRPHYPIRGTISVTHPSSKKVDAHSFTLEGKPLDVSFTKSTRIPSEQGITLSFYQFILPAKEEGLYLLPAIQVKVGEEIFATVPSSYEIRNAARLPPQKGKQREDAHPIFTLEALVKGPQVLYPGERTKLLYRISYNRSIDISKSELPMLYLTHFQKIGDVQILDYQDIDLTKQDLELEVEAAEIGTFTLGPSTIEGYPYKPLPDGQKEYGGALLQAHAPALTLEVKSFPKENQPPSFVGSLGRIKGRVILHSSPEVKVGDEVIFGIEVEGVINLDNLELPPLQCQPGFSGFFQIGDLPPSGKIEKGKKIFLVELRALSILRQEIPSIELSSFDPATEQYVVDHIPPFPLHIYWAGEEPNKKQALEKLSPLFSDWPTPTLSGERKEFTFSVETLSLNGLYTSKVLWMIPLAFLLLFLQKAAERWKRERAACQKQSLLTLKAAIKSRSSEEFLRLWEESLWQRFWEKGFAPQGSWQIEKIEKKHEEALALNSLLERVYSSRYSPQKGEEISSLRAEASRLLSIWKKEGG